MKSHVSMEQHVCLVCGVTFDTGSILLDRRLKASMESHTVTGWGLCPEHEKMHEDGYVALVECEGEQAGSSVRPEDARRTGQVAHIRRSAWPNVFDSQAPESPVVFCEKGLIDKLRGAATC